MADKAAECGGIVIEVISELKEWVSSHLAEVVTVNWASNRALACCREQREAYQVDPKFYEEAKAMLEQYKYVPLSEYFAITEAAYEELLRKYNTPNCFFPFTLQEPDNWD